MATITPNEFKRGMSIVYRDQVFTVVEFHRHRTGMRKAMVSAKLKNIETGQVLENTWNSGEKIETAFVERKPMQYLYRDGDNVIVMDHETYEQPNIPIDFVGDTLTFLKEGDNVHVTIYDGKFIGIEPPDFVELLVTEAPPHVKGDTATAEYRDVTVETGGVVKAPPFVQEGDVIQVDTRNAEYVKRVSKG
jgi:elongation factor P